MTNQYENQIASKSSVNVTANMLNQALSLKKAGARESTERNKEFAAMTQSQS